VTFVIATLIFALYISTGELYYEFFGYFFLLLALPINCVVLIILLLKASKSENPKKIKSGIGLLFLNIPVAIFYFGIGIYFVGIMRITFENNTGKDIKNIKIKGCENNYLAVLKNEETETIWIDINGDCSITLSYVDVTGTTQNETVIGYVCSGMGQKYTYKIGEGETSW
jgi:hypothetical protein